MKTGSCWVKLLIVLASVCLLMWSAVGMAGAQERSTFAEATGVRAAVREMNRALAADEPEEQLVVLVAEDVELIGTADQLLVLRRVYTARTLAGEYLWESLVRGFVDSYQEAYHPELDGLEFFLDYEVSEAPAIEEEVDWEAIFDEQAETWDDAWFGQWQLEPPDVDIRTYDGFLSSSELALAARMVELAEEYRVEGSEEALSQGIRSLYRDYLLSDAAWEAEVEWLFGEVFWDWPGAYTISSAGNLVVPASVAVSLLVWDPVTFELDRDGNRFGRESLIWYTEPYFETDGQMHLVFQQDSLGWFVTAMSVEWSVEWLVALLQAEEVAGH